MLAALPPRDWETSLLTTMIEFSCSCGKKYRLPDRNADREVRCNQCEKTLIVPKRSQAEPVIPLSDQHELVIEPKIETKVDKEAIEKKVDAIFQSVAASTPSKTAPTRTTPSSASDASDKAIAADVPLPSGQPVSLFDDRRSGALSRSMLVLMMVLTIGVGIVGGVLGFLASGISGVAFKGNPSQKQTEELERQLAVEKTEPLKKTVADWKITEDSPFSFDLRTADGAPALLSLDDNPTSKKTGKKSTLDELAVVLDDDQSIKGTESHTISLRVDSASAGELCVVWPRSRDAGLAESDVKELKFCIYFSGTANATHKPDKPKGLDKTLELADFRIRLGDAWGNVEFVLAEKERIALCEKGRLTWYALSVPINGDDVWKRTEHGRMSPKNVDFIEFRAKPTGSGVTFWIDNLAIGE